MCVCVVLSNIIVFLEIYDLIRSEKGVGTSNNCFHIYIVYLSNTGHVTALIAPEICRFCFAS